MAVFMPLGRREQRRLRASPFVTKRTFFSKSAGYSEKMDVFFEKHVDVSGKTRTSFFRSC